jgi:cytochrome P450
MSMTLRSLQPGAEQRYFDLLKYQNLTINFLDAPSHMRIRTLMMKAFSRTQVEKTTPIMDSIISDILNRAEQLREFDFIEVVTSKLPTQVIQGMLGVPPGYNDEFFSHGSIISQAIGSAAPSEAMMAAANKAVIRLNEVLSELLEERRRAPTEDLLSALVQARDSGDRLDNDELLAACHSIVQGGAETTGHLLGVGLLEIARRADLVSLVETSVDSALTVVDELLRYPSLVKGMTRIVVEPFEWHGSKLRAGDLVFVMNCAGNVDPEVFENAFEIIPSRNTRASLAFGPGLHSCIGSFLARAELSHLFHAVFKRFVVTVDDTHLQLIESYVFRGYKSLPVRLTPKKSKVN